ncbi:hypothetical protein [Flavobacterium sp. LHD-85]|uniref:hypothetical protein n=1 Tax=Flavobacterium sp. LHD-85 TaxID=3071410 RepID=UPI0027E185BB|nr:hypothetical protein [Flavobacterium sp. LHD-85]MDQ6530955.1 hypothetical protein [Flavobacterium sp. LHD-85]
MLLFTCYVSNAQVGIGTSLPNSSAQLDIVATNRGILVPRVNLQSTSDNSTIQNGNLNSLLVFNISENQYISQGFYYWLNDKWNKIIVKDDIIDSLSNVIYNSVLNQFSYIDLSGNPVVINFDKIVKEHETLTFLKLDDLSQSLEYKDEHGSITAIDLKELVKANETVTRLVNNGNGTISYWNEEGLKTTISIQGTQSGPQGPPGIDGNGISSTVDNGNGTFTINYTDGGSFTTSDFRGATGAQGPMGDKGDQGFQGIAGQPGLDGAVGAAGAQGPKGDKGDQGVQGIAGQPGLDGAVGATGVQGPKGDKGDQGVQGIAGQPGLDGAVGATGVQGPKGDKGDQGVQGIAGQPGLDGAVGATGVQGPKGDKGDQGVQGIAGQPGLDGAVGAAGAQGPKGDQGVQGIVGQPGLDGAVGATGAQGPKGDQGDQGPQGPAGADGGGAIIQAGDNVSIGGSGSAVDPYIINARVNNALFNTSDNVMHSQIDGVEATALIVTSVTNSLIDGTLTTSVNGVEGSINLNVLSNEPWFETANNGPATTNDQNIYTKGWVGIGGQMTPSGSGSEKLRVNGSITTATTSYPDYVFEDYFKGKSRLKTDYKFKSLFEVDKFIKENNHLPGVASINQLEKTEKGYFYNVSELSIQLLEKTEELYLYTIEQDKELKKLNELLKCKEAEIEELIKKTNKLNADLDYMNERIKEIEEVISKMN